MAMKTEQVLELIAQILENACGNDVEGCFDMSHPFGKALIDGRARIELHDGTAGCVASFSRGGVLLDVDPAVVPGKTSWSMEELTWVWAPMHFVRKIVVAP